MSDLGVPVVSAHDPATVNEIELEKQQSVEHHESKESGAPPVSAYANLSVKESLKTFKRTVVLAFLALFIACSDGYQFSLPGNIIAQTSFKIQFGQRQPSGAYALNASQVAAWGGMYSSAYLVTLFLAGFPMDRFGRKFNMWLITLFMAAACICETLARDWTHWGAAKLLQGFSIGFCQSTLATYVSEIAPTKIRGFLLVGYSFWWAFGQFTAAIGLYVLQQLPNEVRLYLRLIYTEWIFLGLSIIIILLLPESPRHHLRRGNREKAGRALRSLNGGIPDYNVEHELAAMEHELVGERQLAEAGAKASWVDMFKGVDRRRTLVSSSIMMWQQCVGISIVYGYNSVFFAAAGLSNPFLGTVCINLITLVTVFTSGFLVERFGRRPLLLVGGCGIVIALVIIGSLAFFPVSSSIGGATVGLMCFWVLSYSFSAGPCGYLILGETSSPALRAKTTSTGLAMSGCFNLIFSYCSPLMILSTGGGAGWGIKTAYFFAGTAFIGLILVYFYVPEHKDRSFAELNELYEDRVPARKFSSTKTSVQLLAEAPSA